MSKMLFKKNPGKNIENPPYPRELLGDNFGPSDVKDFRDFEDYLIGLGHMTESERVILPDNLEEAYRESKFFNTPSSIPRVAGPIGAVALKRSRMKKMRKHPTDT